MNISSIKYFSTQNGPGFRTAVFVSGCNIHCPGCFNEIAWDFNSGEELTDEHIKRIFDSIDTPEIKGLSILGGEPMDPRNQQGVADIITKFRAKFGDSKTIWMWTGYNEDKIPLTNWTEDILCEVDAAVVGPFIQELHDPELRYAGSTNQKIVKYKEMLA